jgi:1,2-diacylglycerol 3-beta-galactosyltransferase
MARIDFLFFDAGGGHRAAATALKDVIERQRRPWQVRLVHLQDLLRPVDYLNRFTGHDTQEVYNLMLKRGWTFSARYLLPVLHALIGWTTPAQVRLLASFWRDSPPDLVVSLVPNLNRGLFRGLRASGSLAPYVTVLTDIADYPPHTWIERQPQYFICGSDRAVRQARALGHPPDRVFRVSGMILRPQFYEVPPLDVAAERSRLGLRPDLPTALVLFGGHGSKVMLDIARRLRLLPLQLIMMCGHNRELAARLRAAPGAAAMHIQGFTADVPYFMRLAHFLIGKPGPGSVSEALAMKLPVIVDCNASTLPQERYNADWILEHGVGLVVPHFRRVDQAVARMLEPGRLARFRANAAAMNNRAVFEIPDLLERILAATARPAQPT